MATYRYVANSVQEVLKQNTDDADIPLAQILFWASVIANNLRKLHLDKQLKKGSMNGTFLSVWDNVPVQNAPASLPPATIANRKYVDIPEALVELIFDQAVNYITYSYDTGCCDSPAWIDVVFSRTTPSAARRLYMNPHEKPSPENPYFYVIGDKIYFLGIECVTVRTIEMGLYTNYDPNTPCDLDDRVPLPDHLIETLLAQLVNMGRFSFAFPKDRTNDGDDAASDGKESGFDRRSLGNMKPTPRNTEQQQQEQHEQ
jgi:hypothetical protein